MDYAKSIRKIQKCSSHNPTQSAKKKKEKAEQNCMILESNKKKNYFISSSFLVKKFAPLSGHLVGWM